MVFENILNTNVNEKILILGFGSENQQFVKWLLEVIKIPAQKLIIADKQDNLENELISKYNLKTFLGEKYLSSLELQDVEWVFKAPGIWSLLPEITAFRNKKGEDRVNSSLVFFLEKFSDQIIGVNGTKGKTTTSTLITYLINEMNPASLSGDSSNKVASKKLQAFYCGNTSGISPYQFWTTPSQEVYENTYFVIELSSFQLQDLGFAKVSPKYAVITNYYIDHLDQHLNKEEYWAAKESLFKYQQNGLTVANVQVLENSLNLKNQKNLILVTKKDSEIFKNLSSSLIGEHNLFNILNGLFLLESIFSGTTNKQVLTENILNRLGYYSKILLAFTPLSHRLELVNSIQKEITVQNSVLNLEVNFYDDGFATEPDAVVSGIKALTSKENEFLWLQIAGKDKGSELSNIVKTINENKSKMFKIDYCGKVGARLNLEIGNAPAEIVSFRETVENLFTYFQSTFRKDFKTLLDAKTLKKDTLILNLLFSPGGSSFDEFNNQTERANWWTAKVKAIEIL